MRHVCDASARRMAVSKFLTSGRPIWGNSTRSETPRVAGETPRRCVTRVTPMSGCLASIDLAPSMFSSVSFGGPLPRAVNVAARRASYYLVDSCSKCVSCKKHCLRQMMVSRIAARVRMIGGSSSTGVDDGSSGRTAVKRDQSIKSEFRVNKDFNGSRPPSCSPSWLSNL